MIFKPRRTQKLHIVTLFVLFVASIGHVGFSYDGVDTWYETGITEAQSRRIVPNGFDEKAFDEPITRGEFAEAVVLAYLSASGTLPNYWEVNAFQDESNAYADVAKALGIVSGYTDGSFNPDGMIRREEMFVMIHKLITKLDSDALVDATAKERVTSLYSDGKKISAWAVEATTLMVERKIVSGTDKGTLEPKSKTTRAQALVILNNALNTLDTQPITFDQMALALNKIRQSDPTAIAKENLVTVANPTDNGENYNRPDNSKVMNFDSYFANFGTEPMSRGGGRDHRSLEEIYSPEQLMVMLGENTVKYALVFGSAEAPRYQSATEALTHMVTVSFDVWSIGSNGTKVPSKRSVTVNKAIANTVIAIFKEIYEGPEKFPIKNVGGFAWRASVTSEHRWGLAIDINSNENYMIRPDGTVVAGSYWKPETDPYSIKPSGDVVTAFKNHGFTWGGNAWSSSNDYMHFSFLGK